MLLSSNNLGDIGLEILAPALVRNHKIIVVDLSQNGLTPRCASSIATILSMNSSIVEFNVGSNQGGQSRNRLGKEVAQALAYGLRSHSCVLQFLNLRSVLLANSDLLKLAESLKEYIHLLHLDLSSNRIEGSRGGEIIASILARRCTKARGSDLEFLNLANNRLQSGGFSEITHQLTICEYGDLNLNVANNEIDEILLLVAFNPNADRVFRVSNLTLDGNEFVSRTYHKLAALLYHAINLTKISFVRCELGDDGLQITFEALASLRKLTKVDYSSNKIFDKGVSGICPLIGKNQKSVL